MEIQESKLEPGVLVSTTDSSPPSPLPSTRVGVGADAAFGSPHVDSGSSWPSD